MNPADLIPLIPGAIDFLKSLKLGESDKAHLTMTLQYAGNLESQMSTLYAENSSLRAENNSLRSQLKDMKLDLGKCQTENQGMKEELAEESLIKCGVDFRKSKRTGHQWVAFCPKCETPAVADTHFFEVLHCPGGGCGWVSGRLNAEAHNMAAASFA